MRSSSSSSEPAISSESDSEEDDDEEEDVAIVLLTIFSLHDEEHKYCMIGKRYFPLRRDKQKQHEKYSNSKYFNCCSN